MDAPIRETRHSDQAGYTAAHNRVRSKNGKASAHLCVDCNDPATDWSLVGTGEKNTVNEYGYPLTYSLDINRYVPRCRPCHMILDHTAETCLRGHDRTAPGALYSNNSCKACNQEDNQNLGAARRALGLTETDYRKQYGRSAAVARSILEQLRGKSID
jgi:hypothetical protein